MKKTQWNLSVTLIYALVFIFFMTKPLFAARYYIDITSPYFKRIPVAIPEFKILSKGRTLEDRALTEKFKKNLPEVLIHDLEFCGLFRILSPRGFLVDPQKMGVKTGEINFKNWRIQGTDLLVRGAFHVINNTLILELRLFDVVKAKMMVGRAYEAPSEDFRSVIHRFSQEIYKALTGKPGIFLTKIAFVNKIGKKKHLFICDFDGENVQQIIKKGETILSPEWSPDGKKLAYVSIEDMGPALFMADLEQGTARRLCSYRGLNIAPAWNPKKNLLAVTLSVHGNPEIYTIDLNGRVQKRLTKFWGIDVAGSWSPDGRYLAFVSNSPGNPQIYILDTETMEKRRLTFSGNYNTDPSWSPTGEWIAYASLSRDGTNIFRIKPDGTDLQQLTANSGRNEHPSWSPDGRMIVFSSNRTGKQRLWVMFADGGQQKQLTFLSGSQSDPAWSPFMD